MRSRPMNNPANASHTVLMFAIHHTALFQEWVNKSAGDPIPAEEVGLRLDALHAILDLAVHTAPSQEDNLLQYGAAIDEIGVDSIVVNEYDFAPDHDDGLSDVNPGQYL
jgi:hypothetical protein